MQYYAHSLPNAPRSEWQPLEDHLHAVADKAREFAQSFGFGDWAYLAGLWHDLGKYSLDFQRKITERPEKRVDHSTAGARHAVERYDIAGRFLAYTIAGHHAGLADFYRGGDTGGRRSLQERLSIRSLGEGAISIPPIDGAPRKLLEQGPRFPTLPSTPAYLSHATRGMSYALAVRMLFSCLVDADFLDTEQFYNRDVSVTRDPFPSLADLCTRLEEQIHARFDTATGTVNEVRHAVSMDCLREARRTPGFFSLHVPTGGGKTLASLRFALHHAMHHSATRVIYAIPYTSIIEQTAQVFRIFVGVDAVVEHHSNIAYSNDDEDEMNRTRLATENWDAPLIVTTNVQFFESLFATKTSRCRKLHNIAGAVIILDEAQTLPTSLLIPTLAVMRELVEHYGCSIVLCTATQPALRSGPHVPNGLDGVREIVANPVRHFAALDRVRFEYIGAHGYDEIARRVAEHDRVICVVNTRRDAQELFTRLNDDGSRFYLTTFLCPAHREAALREIKARLETHRPCRVVSTQLIEAGVDISAPVVFRAVAGVDSMLQAAGRCNRNGELGDEKGRVFIFDLDVDRKEPRGLLGRTIALGRRFVRESGAEAIPNLDTIEAYFREVYRLEGPQLDARNIMKLINHKMAPHLEFAFHTIATRYRLIDDNGMPIVIRYNDEARRLITSLQYAGVTREVLRTLRRYTITVPTYIYEELARRRGTLVSVADSVMVLESTNLYTPELGFFMREFADMDAPGLVV